MPCVRGRGHPWYGTSAQPESHSTCSSPRGAPRVVPSMSLLNYFGAFLGAFGRGEGGAPGTVPLQNPGVTSRKACLRNAQRAVIPSERVQILGAFVPIWLVSSHTNVMTGHIGTNTPKFVPSRWGWPPFRSLLKRGCANSVVGLELAGHNAADFPRDTRPVSRGSFCCAF